MDIEPNAIFSDASEYAPTLSDERRESNMRVISFVNRGLMTQEAVYERYTEGLAERLEIYCPSAALCISRAFRQLQDPETGYLSTDKFENLIKQTLPAPPLTDLDHSLGLFPLLFEILTWHAAFPFSASVSASASSAPPNFLGIKEDGFLRAICLLTRDPLPKYAPELRRLHTHGMLTGSYGGGGGRGPDGDHGWLLLYRGKDKGDYRRRLFRCLAVPSASAQLVASPSDAATTTPTTIAIPQFITTVSRRNININPSGNNNTNGKGKGKGKQQLVITANELERVIDMQDILSEYPPEVIALTANPLRESYALVAKSLSHWNCDLKQLRVPNSKLVSLVSVVSAAAESVESGGSGELSEFAARVDANQGEGEGYLTWEEFETLVEGHELLIAESLSKVFSVFKKPLGQAMA